MRDVKHAIIQNFTNMIIAHNITYFTREKVYSEYVKPHNKKKSKT